MAGFLYFVPRLHKRDLVRENLIDRAKLPDLHLAELFGQANRCPEQTIVHDVRAHGPGDAGGVILFPKSIDPEAAAPSPFGYHADLQTWLPVAGGRWWIGWYQDAKPDPLDLLRPQTTGYLAVSDSHGRRWLVPTARAPDNPHGVLPVEYTFDEAGLPSQAVARRYLALWRLSGQAWDWIHGRADQEWDWLVDAALQCLATNYRLGRQEIRALHECGLGLLDSATVKSILIALIDQDLPEELAGNLPPETSDPCPAPASSNRSPGPEDSIPDTDPVAAT